MRPAKFLIAIGAAAAGLAASAGSAFAEGLPQLDTKAFAPQLVWLAVSFALLYLLMARVALPRVSEVLEDRKRRIEENLKKAEFLKADAAAMAEAYQKAITEAKSQAQNAVREVREKAAAEAANRQAVLVERLSGQVREAEARIEAARNAAVADIRGMAVEVAVAAAERLLGERPDGAAVQAAVDKAMKERG
ncbi:MAG: F0F1 ATP synthase subunit B' [Magnetospirillum sp. WYHS-4]